MRRVMTLVSQGMALIGGLGLLAIIAMTCVSVVGREVGLGEITGNYEILEAGVAFAIFSFFPICQLHGGHATVDVFTSRLGSRALAILKAFWEVILAAIIVFLAWRLEGGVERYLRNGETTFFLQFPVWWAYSAAFFAASVAALVSLYCAVARVREAISGLPVLPRDGT